MKLSIPAWRDGIQTTFSDVLNALGHDDILSRNWIAHGVEAAGTPEPAKEIEAASDTGTPISGQRLLELALARVQLIEGYLLGTSPTGRRRIALHAVDSTHWDVEGDEKVLRKFAQHFPDAEVLESATE
jgi:hypothetical protein